ncbi:hypothetical protein FRZ67_18380 [Panacibacter ginsenosidivorans]|uniref:Porin n=1 Tax=Panacibacter ginsenosidivorans TaxID=1813871 RepID=A0A5B8VDW9_9BACT|nr:hypothetical protein [Panacibacter ginsenosidivorans]QEC69181.1 hypothetical protein FRZ67_18380 [Panacibacter ginsenosidivorans]
MSSSKQILILFLLVFCATKIFSQDDGIEKPKWLEFHGYVKDLQSVSFGGAGDSLTSSNLIHNRLNFKFNISSKISGRLEIRNRIFYGEQIAQIPGFGKIINQYPGYFNLSKLWVDDSNFVVQSVIDRMLLQYSTDKWDIKIGRQRINWGINNVWNPNDIFNAYNFLDFDYEERPGNDAIRIQHFLKDNSTIEFAYKPGKEKDQTIAAALYKFNKSKYDIQFLGGIFNTDVVAGTGWAGSIKDAGFKGEVSYFHPRQKFTDSFGVVTASMMTDYTFKKNWYGIFSFLFNSEPLNMFNPDVKILNFNLTAKNLFPFRYSFYAGAIKSFTPVTSMNIAIVYSPTNNTLIFFPSFAWNAAKNLDLDLTAQSFFASENGSYQTQGTTIYLRGRWSF